MSTTQLDQGGGRTRFALINAGPTLGLVEVPVATETQVTASPYTVLLPDVYLLVNKTVGAAQSILLPDVALWVKQNTIQTFSTGWDRSLVVCDFKGDADTNNITLTPFDSQKINTLSSWLIVSPNASVCLRPLSDLTGWFVT